MEEDTHYQRLLFPQMELWADVTVLATTQITTSRQDMMSDEARESLGNLEAKAFNADALMPLLLRPCCRRPI